MYLRERRPSASAHVGAGAIGQDVMSISAFGSSPADGAEYGYGTSGSTPGGEERDAERKAGLARNDMTTRFVWDRAVVV